mmetsp:Transcript_13438/g.24327  ORF Transcript_13438/g.24327 Transcript_13438/m.24327 type:complete len:213 (-) Transcript_13438:82-720(-)
MHARRRRSPPPSRMVVAVFLLGLLRQDALVENVVDQMLDRRLVGVFVVDRLAHYGGAPRPHAELRELEHIVAAHTGAEVPPRDLRGEDVLVFVAFEQLVLMECEGRFPVIHDEAPAAHELGALHTPQLDPILFAEQAQVCGRCAVAGLLRARLMENLEAAVAEELAALQAVKVRVVLPACSTGLHHPRPGLPVVLFRVCVSAADPSILHVVT